MNKKSITRRKGVEYGGDDAQATDHSLMEEWSRDPQQRVARLQKTGILEGLTFLQGCEIIGESTNGNNPSFIDPEKEGDIFYFDPEDIPYTPYSYAFSLHDGKGIAYETRSGRTLYLLRSDEVEGEWQLDCRNWWNESTNFKETVLVASLHILGGEV